MAAGAAARMKEIAMRFRLVPMSALLVLCLSPSVGLAQPIDADRTTARMLAQEGHEALERNDFATAADRFARANALVHAPTLMLGLAQAEVGLGKLVSALETYNQILRQGLPPNAPEPFILAVDEARKDFAALAPRIPSVIIQIQGGGAAAVKVTIDGTDVPAAALGVKRAVDPGKHAVRASAEGFVTREVAVTVAEGKTETVTLRLEPAPIAPPGAPPPPKLEPTPPVVVPSRRGAPPPSSAGSTQRTLGIVGLAVGGAGIGLGAAMGGLVIAKHGDLAQSCRGGICPSNQQAALDTYHTYSTVSTVGFVAGGVLAATGIVLFATAPRPRPRLGSVVLDPVLGPGWFGAQGRF
jgi:hypothetical protein